MRIDKGENKLSITENNQLFSILENVIFLKKTALFSSLETHELRVIVTIVEEYTFTQGKDIVRENDVGDSLFIIKEGRVEILKRAKNHENVKLAELGEGDCFGEMALFDTELRSATVRAKESCVLLCIKNDDLNELLLDNPTIAIGFLKIFVNRLRLANQNIEHLSSQIDQE